MKGGDWKNGMCFWYDVSMTGNIYMAGPNESEYQADQLDDLFVNHRGHPSNTEVVSSFNALKILITMFPHSDWAPVIGYTGDIKDKEIILHGPREDENYAVIWVHLPTVKELLRASFQLQFEEAIASMNFSAETMPHLASILDAIKRM